MSSSTINKIMLAAIGLLLVSSVVLVIKIQTRPRITAIEDAASALGIEQTEEAQQVAEQEPVSQEVVKKQIAVTTDRVNVRDIDSEDGRVLKTVEAGEEFDFLEVLGSGWTKVMYEGQEAYIISDCVTLREVVEEAPQTPETTAEEDMEDADTAEEIPQEAQPEKLEIIEVTPQE